MTNKIAVLAGDGIGPEIVQEGLKLIDCLRADFGLDAEIESAAIGGAGYDQFGDPLPEQTLSLCQQADAILFGAIGGPAYDGLERELRPEKGLLRLRSSLSLFSNLRPAMLYPQ
jgi:3-isopropylmalate dehydrogenase